MCAKSRKIFPRNRAPAFKCLVINDTDPSSNDRESGHECDEPADRGRPVVVDWRQEQMIRLTEAGRVQ